MGRRSSKQQEGKKETQQNPASEVGGPHFLKKAQLRKHRNLNKLLDCLCSSFVHAAQRKRLRTSTANGPIHTRIADLGYAFTPCSNSSVRNPAPVTSRTNGSIHAKGLLTLAMLPHLAQSSRSRARRSASDSKQQGPTAP
jgi:hypothetical protein